MWVGGSAEDEKGGLLFGLLTAVMSVLAASLCVGHDLCVWCCCSLCLLVCVCACVCARVCVSVCVCVRASVRMRL